MKESLYKLADSAPKKKPIKYESEDLGYLDVLSDKDSSESPPIDKNKEYFFLRHHESYSTRNRMASIYSFMSTALEANQVNLLDLNGIQENINEHFKYLFLKKRLDNIRKTAKFHIECDYDGFHIKDSTFETLDEVEKALANSAFL